MEAVQIGDKIAVVGIVKRISKEVDQDGNIYETVTIKFPEAETWSNAIVMPTKKL